MKIEWASIKVPPRRRMQTLATGIYTFGLLGLAIMSPLLTAVLLFYANYMVKALVIIYIVYIYVNHSYNHSALNGNGWMLLRNNFLGKHFRDYFPVKLVKTADLPANKNYLLVSFPHGVLGAGIFINMGLDIEPWLQYFPGVRPKIATLDQNFYAPILREFLRLCGVVSVARDSLTYHLGKSNNPNHPNNKDGFTSNAVAVLVGGAQEALDSQPGKYILTLKNRKGFVKVAIRSGTPIVPSLSFGEVDIFSQVDNPPDSSLRRVQNFVKKITGIAPLIVIGRGFFNYTIGMLPHRKPIVQVIGASIEVEQSNTPDPLYVDKVHGQVIQALETIFETYKLQYLKNPTKSKLVIH